MSCKNEEMYNEVFSQLKKLIKLHSNSDNFSDIKIMDDFELPLRKAIKYSFDGRDLEGYYCKAIWKKIKNCIYLKRD